MKSKQQTCNKELLNDVQLATKESTAVINSAVGFYSKFIADVMKTGAFESVMIPYFGKFQPKTKEIQWKAHRRGLTPNTVTNAEPIHSDGELRSGAEQGMDHDDPSLQRDTES